MLAGITLLVYMSLRLGGIQFGAGEGYRLVVRFPSAAGLDKGASVRVAGVEVGKVDDIELDNNMARLTLLIDPEVKVGRDFTAVLNTKGLLGEKFVQLMPGAPGAPPLKPGEEIVNTKVYAEMDQLITLLSDVATDLKSVSSTLGKVLGGPRGEQSLASIVKNIEELTERVNTLVAGNERRFSDIMRNLDDFTSMLSREGPGFTKSIKETFVGLNSSLKSVSDNLNALIADNKENLSAGIENLRNASARLEETMETINNLATEVEPEIKDTVASIGSVARKIDSGEGTIAKLINDPDTHDNLNRTIKGINRYLDKARSFRLHVGYRGEYLLDGGETKGYFTLKVQPRSDRYYLLEVVDDPRGSRSTETIETSTAGATTTVTETRTTEDLKFSLQMAMRFQDLVLRGGLIESTGGVGADYYLLDDRLRFTLEAFDFDTERNPHLKAGATLHLNRFLFLTAGYDDFISRSGMSSAYVGAGLLIEDDDLKYIFGSAPPIAF